MEQFATEEQQVEAIKKFWKDNGMAIVVGALIGLGALWGWRYYSDTQRVAREEASVAYQDAVVAVEDKGQIDELTGFVNETNNAGYATIGGLVAAQQAVKSGDLEKAASLLKGVRNSAPDEHIATMSSIRLARVQLELGNTDEALATLKGLEDKAFSAKIEEVRGDIYVAQEKFNDARMAYTDALENASGNALLEMKLDNLPVLAGN